jgi:hypothetical protein
MTLSTKNNHEYWLAISHSHVSDVYSYTIPCDILRGETNLPVGENLNYSRFLPIENHSVGSKNQTVNPVVIDPTVRFFGTKVTQGVIPGVNTFELLINTSDFSNGEGVIIWNPRYKPEESSGMVSATTFLSNYPSAPIKRDDSLCASMKLHPLIQNISGTPSRISTSSSGLFFYTIFGSLAIVFILFQQRKKLL